MFLKEDTFTDRFPHCKSKSVRDMFQVSKSSTSCVHPRDVSLLKSPKKNNRKLFRLTIYLILLDVQ